MREQIYARLLALSEQSYLDLSSAIIPNSGRMLGVRLPKLRALAREIAADSACYLAQPCGDTFEEIMLRGMVIGCMKCPTEQRIQYIRSFVPCIGNWSVCDSFCAGLKEANNKPEVYWQLALSYLHSAAEFEVRFGVVMLLDYFARGVRIPRTLEQLEGVTHEGYYVKMAVAWAISVCYIRDAAGTWDWLQRTELDEQTVRMAIQKILDSRRVQGRDRQRIRMLREQRKRS